ncbi:DUF4296 domain-containing protein [Flavobacteriaceae bacterium F89]|uniref:DUF4296 domain-containing protein n=1 Tax=Cerina litoralis TaxID=2874477 RepID=A0AAE3JQW5_9FLAO|nr:DUF4296 domain-containing protein [Cerina litoralis]MCG2460678.1 DUF4296 domain-containing protein [Cerina litoralis]
MKKGLYLLALLFFVVACAEKVIKEPNNLIPMDKMEDILYDIAITTAARNINAELLRKNNVEVMAYIYAKYGIDSIQFAESDIYYASIPSNYEAIYSKILDSIKIGEKIANELQKKHNDSITEAVKRANKPPVLKK